ncbi:hypothetical protein HU200_036588 [Digitaria exilis]|uniref:Protein kinase domain-containing protein n=1 Tax=Digitaria exilis TaxID=1010633 RepID=A0A835EKD3_9POAL|nr:hypothetical protein HU200_036588 [Digitaria exilis]CAB3477654.1 unnamed protein product [Digitaria exilis]
MEQLRQLGEVVGSINVLMAFEPDLRINPRQCRLLADACAHALAAVTGEVRSSLRFDERGGAKWRAIEHPLRELHRAFRDAEGYLRHCLDPRGSGGSFWARAAAVGHGTECVEQHLHGILWCVAVAVEAVEAASEIAGSDPGEIARRRTVLAKKYDGDVVEPGMFQNAHGEVYLVSRELVSRMDMAWKEDRWLLSQLLDEMKPSLTKSERRLADVLAAPRGKVHPASILLTGDYTVRRRLGGGLKEVQWMGESFAVRHFIGNAEAVEAEVAVLASVAHPNVAHAAYCFRDEERKEHYVVMDQLMPKDLGSYVKEVSCPRRRVPFPLVVAVDVMLQIARGMEHLHANKIYHGELNPSNVLVKPRQPDGYVHVKVAGFERSGTVTTTGAKASTNANANSGEDNSTCIWYAPEVLEKEEEGLDHAARRTEKADVYSFGMICFELLTGKVPFEDNHLQGDKTSKNIRAGERPLFPFQAPKYVVALTKRCWHADPAQRPAFASVCRVLRNVKRFLVMNPDQQQGGQADASHAAAAPGAADYLDIEAQLLRRIPAWQGGEGARVADVPFQMFAYRAVEREKAAGVANAGGKDRVVSDLSSEGNSLCGEENGATPDDASTVSGGTVRSRPESSEGKKTPVRKADGKAPPRQTGSQTKVKAASAVKPPSMARKTMGAKPEVAARRPTSGSGHTSD